MKRRRINSRRRALGRHCSVGRLIFRSGPCSQSGLVANTLAESNYSDRIPSVITAALRWFSRNLSRPALTRATTTTASPKSSARRRAKTCAHLCIGLALDPPPLFKFNGARPFRSVIRRLHKACKRVFLRRQWGENWSFLKATSQLTSHWTRK